MTFHFDCVFYYVSDMARSIRFYTDVLGLKLISRDVLTRFDIDGVLFELVPSGVKLKPRQTGNARLRLRVDSVTKSLQQLKSKGVYTSQAQDKSTGVLGSFEDPDGNEIRLWQYLPEKEIGGRNSSSTPRQETAQ